MRPSICEGDDSCIAVLVRVSIQIQNDPATSIPGTLTHSTGEAATTPRAAPNPRVPMGIARWRGSPRPDSTCSAHAPARAPAPIAPSNNPRATGPPPTRRATTGASSWMGPANTMNTNIPTSRRRAAASPAA